jgi:transcriptional regulator with XRE-family HTH domain
MKIEEKLGRKIKQLRIIRGISQEELAFRCDLHRTYISSIELGKRNVSIRNIEKIALALNVELVEFFKNE